MNHHEHLSRRILTFHWRLHERSSGSYREGPVVGPLLPDRPGFRVPCGSFLRSQPGSSSSPFSRLLLFSTCSGVFCFISSFHFAESFRLLLIITIAIGSTFASFKISSFLRCSNRLTPIAHRTSSSLLP